ncbi:MAG TPA: lipocalin-like domain-containing protein [Gammaproteobacteria bacterium]|nr:lipocalin-like domain-containing protein [Gammaproteobacteria bacterium]
MKKLLAVVFALGVTVAAQVAHTQPSDPAAGLIGSWMLVAAERGGNGDEAEPLRGVRGLLVIDGAGNVFEFFSTATRDEPESPQIDPQRTFATFGGFWGRYEVDAATGRLDFEAEAGVSPNVRGLSFSRSYELDGDRLVLTSGNEPQAQADTSWTWSRLPIVEHLSPAYGEVVGFWRHVEERRVDTATGEIQNSSQRAPSVIVYTPSGFAGVHFPSLGREPFAGPLPTAEEAREGLRGYIGYFGSLGVYPGEVSHNVLAGISPGTGAILRRYAEITGDELIVTLQGTAGADPNDPPRTVTEVVLRRLSGAEDMLPPTP